ncbi:MAG: signal peptidase I [Chloroflexota bacterium]
MDDSHISTMNLTASERKLPRPKIRRFSARRELLDLIILIAAIYALVNLSTVRFVVQGPSMEPTFHDNQFLIVSRVNYLLGEPERGDIIVFHYPDDTEEDYIKRVIGLPGETIFFQDGMTHIDGEVFEETYINGPCTPFNCDEDREPVVLGPDEYFVMGDNRNRSRDSRDFGPIRREYIVGEVLIRYWPPEDWGLVSQVSFSGN